MTKQEYYDLLVRSAGDGTFPSMVDGICRLREDLTKTCPRRCAIGLLISDDSYNEGLESLGPRAVWNMVDFVRPEGMVWDDLVDILEVHDEIASFCKSWSKEKFVEGLDLLNCFLDVEKVVTPEEE
jgi:hypothetical protein